MATMLMLTAVSGMKGHGGQDIRSNIPKSGLLSPREQEVLHLVSQGYRDREIAERLFLSHHTVANHVRNILGKLEVQSRAAAISLALRSGLI